MVFLAMYHFTKLVMEFLPLFSKPDFNIVLFAGQINRDEIPGEVLPVHAHFDDTLADALRIVDDDPDQPAPEPAHCRKAAPG
jgi:hypothetical protein